MTTFRFSRFIIAACALAVPSTVTAAPTGADWLDVCREAGDFKAPKPGETNSSVNDEKTQHEAYVGRLEIAMRARKYDEDTKGPVRSLCTAYNYGFLEAMKFAAAIADAAPSATRSDDNR